MNYRVISINDLDEVLKFCLELKEQNAMMTFTSFDTREKIKELFNDQTVNMYVSATDEGIITSMFRAKRGEGNKSQSTYVACAVKKEYRKMNLATSLTNYSLEIEKSNGVLIARTKIYSWNHASISTIKKCGFVEGGRIIMHQYEESVGDYIDDIIFHKVL